MTGSLHPAWLSRFSEPATVHHGRTRRGGQCLCGDKASVRVDVQGGGRPSLAESPRVTFRGTNSACPWDRPAFVCPDAPSHSRERDTQPLLQTDTHRNGVSNDKRNVRGPARGPAAGGWPRKSLERPQRARLTRSWVRLQPHGVTVPHDNRPQGRNRLQCAGGWRPGRTRQRGELGCGVGGGCSRRCPVVVGTHGEWMARPRSPAGHGWKGPGCASLSGPPAIPALMTALPREKGQPCRSHTALLPVPSGAILAREGPPLPPLVSMASPLQGPRDKGQLPSLAAYQRRPTVQCLLLSSWTFGPARIPSDPGRPRPSPGPPRPLTSVMPAGRGPLCNFCTTDRNSACSPHPHTRLREARHC